MASGAAHARAALAGNPSDGYGGAVLAVTIADFRARAEAVAAGALSVTPRSALVEATARRFARKLEPAAATTALTWETSIPRAVGLGGSSAIVVATIRALCTLYGVELAPSELASLALAVETDDLGIAAGLQDRVAQAYGGLTFMEFGAPSHYQQLDPALLPELVLAWREDAAQDSGPVHRDLRARFERGEPTVREAISELASLARGARDALIDGDHERLGGCVDASFDARRRMMALDPRHVAMIDTARAAGMRANYAGSGGAIVGICPHQRARTDAGDALAALGCTVTLPQIARQVVDNE